MTKGKETQPHIAIFGRRNSGKSSLINTLAGQELSIVSDFPGTTTDPVKKSIEIAKVGASVLIDTAGLDDVGELGKKRIDKSLEIINSIDFAIVVFSENLFGDIESNLIERLYDSSIPYILLHNKSDICKLDVNLKIGLETKYSTSIIEFSTIKNYNLNEIFNRISSGIPENAFIKQSLLGGLINYGDIVLMITPIDSEAPEGRLILPQVQAIRDILDNDAIAIVLKEREVDTFLRRTKIKPALAITDSQIFLKADSMIPRDIPLTGFSILLARFKGDFEAYLEGTPKISELRDGDRILLLESCTHHVSCDDIGRVKIPRWISNFTGKSLEFETIVGLNKLPRNLSDYALIIQCGGCVITKKQLQSRISPAKKSNISITNYGMAIAYVQGIYNRAIEPFIKNQKEDYL